VRYFASRSNSVRTGS